MYTCTDKNTSVSIKDALFALKCFRDCVSENLNMKWEIITHEEQLCGATSIRVSP